MFKVIDRLFDLMNSRNPHAAGFKSPLGSRNWEEMLGFMTEAPGYLTSLMMKDGTPLHRSKRFSVFVWFCSSSKVNAFRKNHMHFKCSIKQHQLESAPLPMLPVICLEENEVRYSCRQ